MLQRLGPLDVSDQAEARDFHSYLAREVRTAPRTDAERDALFRQFILWREQQRRQ
jgi:hypothetical protein